MAGYGVAFPLFVFIGVNGFDFGAGICLFFATPEYVYFYSFLALLSVIRHRANISRLIRGEESKIKLKKKAE